MKWLGHEVIGDPNCPPGTMYLGRGPYPPVTYEYNTVTSQWTQSPIGHIPEALQESLIFILKIHRLHLDMSYVQDGAIMLRVSPITEDE